MKPSKNEGSIQLVFADVDGTLVTLEKVLYPKKHAGSLRQKWPVDDALLKHLSPLAREHVNLTGDYVWHANK
jgi:hypothetical protein